MNCKFDYNGWNGQIHGKSLESRFQSVMHVCVYEPATDLHEEWTCVPYTAKGRVCCQNKLGLKTAGSPSPAARCD